jgi:hypothetical protein
MIDLSTIPSRQGSMNEKNTPIGMRPEDFRIEREVSNAIREQRGRYPCALCPKNARDEAPMKKPVYRSWMKSGKVVGRNAEDAVLVLLCADCLVATGAAVWMLISRNRRALV